MANARDLESKARAFAQQMQDLLNRTVCEYALFGAVVLPTGVTAGTRVTTSSFQSKPVVLMSTARIPIWLDVRMWLDLDGDEAKFLTVNSSVFGISFGEEEDLDEWVHYDFERGKSKYTEAHIQVHGRHDLLEAYAAEVGAKDRLGRYHFPVGGRRLRPCLEDVIEFVVAERLVEPHTGWEAVLDERRKAYRRKQIAALVRKNPGTAIEELERLGYSIQPPKDKFMRAKIMQLLGKLPKDVRRRSKKG